jgi:hypothetical protein
LNSLSLSIYSFDIQKMTAALTDIQVAELRKAFAIFDGDGNGKIDAQELRNLLVAMGNDATEEDAQNLMKLVDLDGSGTIEFDEFANAMSSWLVSDVKSDVATAASGGGSRKRKAVEEERVQIHKKVRSFFTQFRTSTANLDSIRAEMKDNNQMQLVQAFGEPSDMLQDASMSATAYDAAAKLDFLMKLRTTMEGFASVVASLRAMTTATTVVVGREREALDVVNCIVQCLSVVEVFPTAADRRTVADDIVQLFELVARLAVVPALVVCLRSAPAIAAAAAHAIRLIAPGPRIASTPESSLLHPSQMFFKKARLLLLVVLVVVVVLLLVVVVVLL